MVVLYSGKRTYLNLLTHQDIEFNRFGMRNNVAQLCVLEMNSEEPESKLCARSSEKTSRSPRRLVVGNIHVLFNPKHGDIKLGQCGRILMAAMKLHSICRLMLMEACDLKF